MDEPGRNFNHDMCHAFVSAGISWNKLNNPAIRSFLEKYTNKSIPAESTLRKNYLPKIYVEVYIF